MSADRTREMLDRYLTSRHEDLSMMSDDVVFTTMSSGQEHQGREAVRAMLQYIYHVAFDAHAEVRTLVCETDHAVLEGLFVGRHIGDFAGVPPTGREVRVPLCVVYDITSAGIRRGRVYFEMPVLLAQLGVEPAMAAEAPAAGRH